MLLGGQVLHAQFQSGLWTGKEAYRWYMGRPKAFDFATTPPAVSVDGVSYGDKGGGTVSDANGQLLFYTDGQQIWNKNHVTMVNGTGITNGGAQATQSGLIVKDPGNPNLYYVFTVAKSNSNGGIFYSIVDITLDNGLGAVVSGQKKKTLQPKGVAEKLSAVYHADEKQVWVVGHKANNAIPAENDEFVAFLVTETGITTTPVVSKLGQAFHQFKDGQMKISPDGSKIALVHSQGSVGPNVFEVFNFNNTTGAITGPILSIADRFSSFSSVWGLEFSPNSKLIYVTEIESRSRLYQYDLTAGSDQEIRDTEVILGEVEFLETFYGLQAGPDGKIYMAHNNRDYHSVIQYPNNAGVAAGFSYQNSSPVSATSTQAFPNFIQTYFESGILFENTCIGDATTFSLIRIPGVTAITWDFGDTASTDNTSTNLLPTHVYSAVGTYTVTATITSNGGTQTATNQVVITELPTATAPADVNGCDPQSTGTYNFDLSAQNAVILGTQDEADFTVTYHNTQADADAGDAAITGDLTAYPSQGETIYARVTNNATGCHAVTNFDLIIVAPIVPTAPLEAIGCSPINLTQVSNDLGVPATDVTLKYYPTLADAEQDTNEITAPEAYTLVGQTAGIYISVTQTATGCITYLPITVNLNPGVTPPAPLEVVGCSPINLTSVTTQLGVPATDVTVTYYANEADAMAGTDAIDGTAYTLTGQTATVYIRIVQTSTNCISTAPVTVNLNPGVTPPAPLEVVGCSPINLTGVTTQLGVPATDVTVTYYTNETDAIAGTDAIDGTVYTLTGQTATVYIRIVQTSTNCISTAPVTVNLNPGITPPAPLEVVGCSPINLTSVTNQLGVPATDVIVTYYDNEADAITGTGGMDGTDYTLTGTTATVYIRIVQTATNCISTAAVTVNLNPGITPPAALAVEGCETVNLTNVVSQLGVPANTVEVTYYNSQDDALAQTNAIADAADFGIANDGQLLYVRVRGINTNCINVFEVTINKSAGVELPSDLAIAGCSPFNLNDAIEAESGITYTFYTSEADAATANNTISNPEEYSPDTANGITYVRAENASGCFALAGITLTRDCDIQKGISPNGDTKNDNFDLTHLEVAKLIILNRYGKEVYSLANYTNQWEGQQSNGKELPTGTYFYMIERKNGESKTGWIYINREN
ncbi:hypothetical protein AMR72_08530 [Flavobacterium psychrophilum]|nr:hypothetical protein AMR72_08530 [Flavobacterium psychrophilum]AOE52545.1 hypothetical protein ALW18_08520 [Flavobacterium psychrophilum]